MSFSRYSYVVVEPRSTREIEIIFKLIAKVPVASNTANTPKSGEFGVLAVLPTTGTFTINSNMIFSRQPDTCALGFILFQTLRNPLKYVINFLLLHHNYTCFA